MAEGATDYVATRDDDQICMHRRKRTVEIFAWNEDVGGLALFKAPGLDEFRAAVLFGLANVNRVHLPNFFNPGANRVPHRLIAARERKNYPVDIGAEHRDMFLRFTTSP